jgi:hypothetical protein
MTSSFIRSRSKIILFRIPIPFSKLQDPPRLNSLSRAKTLKIRQPSSANFNKTFTSRSKRPSRGKKRLLSAKSAKRN